MIWTPDTCSCKIEMRNTTFVNWVRKCELHKNLDNQALLDAVLSHNRSFNLKFGNVELTDNQISIIAGDKQTERNRIKLLGSGVSR